MEDSKNGEDNEEAVGGRGATLPMKFLLGGAEKVTCTHGLTDKHFIHINAKKNEMKAGNG